jgi:hypothetical protein
MAYLPPAEYVLHDGCASNEPPFWSSRPGKVENFDLYSQSRMTFIFFVLAAVMLAAYCQAGAVGVRPAALQSNLTSSNCGGNCPGGCSSCPCGTNTNYQDIASWCAQHSWNQVCTLNLRDKSYIPYRPLINIPYRACVAQANCQCIMSHESGGNANAVNQNSGGSYDVGLWQINDYNWNACSG